MGANQSEEESNGDERESNEAREISEEDCSHQAAPLERLITAGGLGTTRGASGEPRCKL